jgi:hypothetical protein
MIRKLTLIQVLLAAVFFANCSQKDYLLVIDSSGSMAERNTLKRVKASMPGFLDAFEKGDRVTLLQFDTSVREVMSVELKGDAERKQLQTAIEDMKAKGLYTDMAALLLDLKQRAAAMEKEGRKAHIIVLSDGLDDPRPGLGRKAGQVDLGKFRSEEESALKESFVYYISLGEIANPALEEQLKKMAPKSQTYLAGARTEPGQKPGTPDGKPGAPAQVTPEQALSQVGSDVKKNFWLELVQKYWPYALGVLVLAALIALGVWLFRTLTRGEPLYGTLLYYPEGIQFPNKNTFTLDKIGRAAVTIGARQGSRLRIKDLGTTELFSFKGKKVGPNLCLRPLGKSARNIQFVSQRQQGLISPGDRFRIGDYSFIFNDEEG